MGEEAATILLAVYITTSIVCFAVGVWMGRMHRRRGSTVSKAQKIKPIAEMTEAELEQLVGDRRQHGRVD